MLKSRAITTGLFLGATLLYAVPEQNFTGVFPVLTGPTELKNVSVNSTSPHGFFTQGNPLVMENVSSKQPLVLSIGGDMRAGGGKVKPKSETVTLGKGNARFAEVYLGGLVDTGFKGRTGAFSGPVTLTVNGSDIDKLYLGHSVKADQLFNGDVTVILNTGSIKEFTDAKRKIGWLNGALQIICNDNSSIGRIDIKTKKIRSGIYILNCAKGVALSATGKSGVFRTAKFVEALNKQTGKVYYSVSGLLRIPAGKYSISSRKDDAYSINSEGAIITIKAPCKLDFSHLEHPEKKGYLFLGWGIKDGKGPVNGSILNAGTVLRAQYIPFDASRDLALTVPVLTAENKKPALQITLHKANSLDKLKGEFSLLSIPKLYARFHELTPEGKYPFPWNDKNIFSAKKLSPKSRKGEVLTYIYPVAKPEDYARAITFRAVISFRDYNGISRLIGSEERSASVTSLAKTANRKDLIAAAYQAEMKPGVTDIPLRKGEGMGNEKAYIIKSSGLVVLELPVQSLKPNTPPVTLAVWADNHFKYANDADRADTNIMAAFSRRGTANPPDRAAQSAQREMEYATFCDQSIVMGDNVDYFTYGSFEVWKKMVLDGDPELLAAIGFHDYVTYTINGRPWSEKPMKETFPIMKKYIPNDCRYATKVMGDKVLLVVLDNSRNGNYYFEDKVHEKLAVDLARARKNNWIVLIFQHEGVYSNTYAKDASGKYDAKKDRELNRHRGFTLHSGNIQKIGGSMNGCFTGKENNAYSQVKGTKAVHKLFFDNADIIRGIYHGHIHMNVAYQVHGRYRDSSGKWVPRLIPQYSVCGSVFCDNGWLLRITIK